MTDHLTEYINEQTELLIDRIIQPLRDWYENTKEVSVELEELLEVLRVPLPTSTNTRSSAPQVRSTASDSTKRTRRGPTRPDRPQCAWIFIRGDNKDKQCPNKAVEGSQYCSGCKPKKAAGGTGRKSASKKTSEAPSASKTSATSILTKPKEKEKEEEDLEAVAFGTTKTGHCVYLDTSTGFLMKEVSSDIYTIIGKVSSKNKNKMVPLTEDDKPEALAIGLEIEEGVELA